MLVTILTMIFNQSSIAWRTGEAGVKDLGKINSAIAELRDEADNAFIWNNKVYRHIGLWEDDGQLRNRACDAPGFYEDQLHSARMLRNLNVNDVVKFEPYPVGLAAGDTSWDTYSVNVKSAGPDRTFDTYDDIWSWPDDFDE